MLLLLMVSGSLLADPVVTTIAFPGSFGVNLADTDYMERVFNEENKKIEWVDENTEIGKYNEDRVHHYLRKHTIAHGGIFSMDGQIQPGSDPEYTVTFEAPNGFNFVNNANPIYIRPFRIQVLQNYVDTAPETYMQKAKMVDDNLAWAQFKWSDINGLSNPKESKFDLLLVLEGDVDNGVLTVNNRQYPLAEGEYSALLTVNITATYTDVYGQMQTRESSVTIPMSGYYYGDDEGKMDDTVGIYINPYPIVSNLNLATMGGNLVSIAELEVMKYLSNNPDDQGKWGQDDIRIFFSSNPDPFTKGSRFSLVHTSVPAGGLLTSANHVKYSVYADGARGRADAVFEGDASVQEVMASGDTAAYISTEHHENTVSSTYYHYHTYSGEIRILMDEPTTAMLPGIYRSTIYVHVIAPDM